VKIIEPSKTRSFIETMETKNKGARIMAVCDVLNHDETFRYQILSRLKMDCEYYLNYGNRAKRNLWATNERDHIDTMLALYESFPETGKPEWLTIEQIKEYENKMIAA